mgnify:CR=1 FL=1
MVAPLHRRVLLSLAAAPAIFAAGCSLFASSLRGGVTEPSELVDARAFFVEEEGQMLPVVGADSIEKVIVQTMDGKLQTVRMESVAWQAERLPPAGRVTVIENKGVASSGNVLTSNYLQKYARVSISMKLVSDTTIGDAYVAMLFMGPDSEKPDSVSFCPIGELEAGKVEKKTILFPSIYMGEGWRYGFEFYWNGLPLEMFRLNAVAKVPASLGLMIPWEERIGFYLDQAREDDRDAKPRSFQVALGSLDPEPCRQRGMERIQILINIGKDGKAEMLQADPDLTPAEVRQLKMDVANWRFFPALEKGKPIEFKVKLPLRI